MVQETHMKLHLIELEKTFYHKNGENLLMVHVLLFLFLFLETDSITEVKGSQCESFPT